MFYGYTEQDHPDEVPRRPADVRSASPDQGDVLARYRRRRRLGAERPDARRRRDRASAPFAIDVPGGYHGKGRVILFSNNPIYRWQNHGEFNMVFNAMLNWNDMGAPPAPGPRITAAGER